MAERTTRKRSTAKPKQPQRAATPKPAVDKQPRPQRAAVPSRNAPRRAQGQARQTPPLAADLVAHFGGQEQVDLIVAECVPADASAGDVLRLLLEARRLGADPLRRDVYLARGSARDGGAFEYAVAARRDALLAFAERQPSFRGFDADAVYEGERFERVEPLAEGTLRQRAGVVHTKIDVSRAPDAPARLVKAWCIVDREGRPPLTFEALRDEYLPADERDALDPDDPRRRYPDRWLVKVAMCWPLRMAFGLNDVVGAEELARRPEPLPQIGEPAAPALFPERMDPIDERIFDAYRQAQALDPLLWPAAKLQAQLASAKVYAASDERHDLDALRSGIAAEIERDVATEVVRRRDPHANARRLAELKAFDASTLDADDLLHYRTELAAVQAAVDAAGAAA